MSEHPALRSWTGDNPDVTTTQRRLLNHAADTVLRLQGRLPREEQPEPGMRDAAVRLINRWLLERGRLDLAAGQLAFEPLTDAEWSEAVGEVS